MWIRSIRERSKLQRCVDEIEAQQETTVISQPTENTFSLSRRLCCLATYFVLNLGLTLSNKAILQRAHYPWLLTVLHATFTSLGCCTMLGTAHTQLTSLTIREQLSLLAFSSLFTLNIAISNVSLALISVALHQVLRSTSPMAVILIYRFVYGRSYKQQIYLSMMPLIFGVGMTTYGDYSSTRLGLVVTFVGVLLAAAKTIASNRFLTGALKLSPLEILLRIAPLVAGQCLLFAMTSGEISRARVAYSQIGASPMLILALFLNALIAFSLNIVSFHTNKVCGALTISVCGNLKQVLTILMGTAVFNVEVTLWNGIGMAATMVGAAWYSKVEFDTRFTDRRADRIACHASFKENQHLSHQMVV